MPVCFDLHFLLGNLESSRLRTPSEGLPQCGGPIFKSDFQNFYAF